MLVKKTAGLNRLDYIASLLIFLLPIGYFAIHRWTEIFSALLLVVALVYYIFTKKARTKFVCDANAIVISLILIAPIGTLLISQLVTGHVIARDYDAPSRFAFSLVLFFYLRQSTIDVGKILQYAIPFLLLANLLAVVVFHQSFNHEGRFGTYTTDPLTFGDSSMVFGFMVLATIGVFKDRTIFLTLLKYFAYFLGVFLSLASQSRGGWCAFPLLLVLYIVLNWQNENRKTLYAFVFANLAFLLIAFLTVPMLHDRMVYWAYEHRSYVTHTAIDTSEGLRLTMWKMSWALFKQHPFFGFGSYEVLKPFLNDPTIKSIGTPSAIDALAYCGPHNQIIAAALMTGIFGIFSTIALFLVPFYIFAKRLFVKNDSVRLVSRLGVMYIAGFFVASLTMEIYNLKYTATFFAMMLVMLTAAALRDTK